MPDFSGTAVNAPVKIAVQNQSAADAGGNADEDHVPMAPARAQAMLRQGRHVGIVVQPYGNVQPVFQHVPHGYVVQLGNIAGFQHKSPVKIDVRGEGRADAPHFLGPDIRPPQKLLHVAGHLAHHLIRGQFLIGGPLDDPQKIHTIVKNTVQDLGAAHVYADDIFFHDSILRCIIDDYSLL